MTKAGIQDRLGLDKPPVAVGFFDAPPDGLDPWRKGAVPAGCAFWRAAQDGQAFYTRPEDHYQCAVGAYTHAIPLPVARAVELEQTVVLMVQVGYLRMEEVAGIPHLPKTPAIIAYAPAKENRFPPSVVIVAARPAQAMLLYEAALAAGAAEAVMPALGRPGCAVLPLAQQTGKPALSFGCRGNRTFTGLPDSELYVAVPGHLWKDVADQIAPVAAANNAMWTYYQEKQDRFDEIQPRTTS